MTATEVRISLTFMVAGVWLLALVPFTVAGVMNAVEFWDAVVLTIAAVGATWIPWRRKSDPHP